jgi:nucleotide-binding universal stress UspA family protein
MLAAKILGTAKERNSGLIVLGVRKAVRTPASASHFATGVAHKVLVGAECPVLTIRR